MKKVKIYEDTEEEKELNLTEEEIEFIKAYQYFGFEFYGTNIEVLEELNKFFETAKITYSISDSTKEDGYIFNYEKIGNKINNLPFAIFVMWYMNEKRLLDYGTSPRNSWCNYQEFGFSETIKNYDYYGYIITKYFRNNSVDWIYDLLDIDVEELEE